MGPANLKLSDLLADCCTEYKYFVQNEDNIICKMELIFFFWRSKVINNAKMSMYRTNDFLNHINRYINFSKSSSLLYKLWVKVTTSIILQSAGLLLPTTNFNFTPHFIEIEIKLQYISSYLLLIFLKAFEDKIIFSQNNINKNTRAYLLYLQILKQAIGPIFAESFHVLSIDCSQVAEQNVFQ